MLALALLRIEIFFLISKKSFRKILKKRSSKKLQENSKNFPQKSRKNSKNFQTISQKFLILKISNSLHRTWRSKTL